MPPLQTNDDTNVTQWPSNPITSLSEPTQLQNILVNTLTVVLALASLVVAVVHFVHQRRSIRHSDRRSSTCPHFPI
ncbi:hypothetical protein P280DRAFT_468752, partial [Massarina eburnea CBS 473.64]